MSTSHLSRSAKFHNSKIGFRFPANSAVTALVARFRQRNDALLRDLEDDLDDLLQEHWRAGYQQGFQEGVHELRRDDE
jgi:hypothetical protein